MSSRKRRVSPLPWALFLLGELQGEVAMKESKKDKYLLTKIKWEACRRNPDFIKKFNERKEKNKGKGVKRILETFLEEYQNNKCPEYFEIYLSQAIYDFDIEKDFEQNVNKIGETHELFGDPRNKKTLLGRIIHALNYGPLGGFERGVPVFEEETTLADTLMRLDTGMLSLNVDLSYPLKDLIEAFQHMVKCHQLALKKLNPNFKIKKERRIGRRVLKKVAKSNTPNEIKISNEKNVKQIFYVYDQRKQNKSFLEIAKKLWPKELEKYSDYKGNAADKKYSELSAIYRKKGIVDWDEMAFSEAYSSVDLEKNLLIQRVQDYCDKAKEWIDNPVDIR